MRLQNSIKKMALVAVLSIVTTTLFAPFWGWRTTSTEDWSDGTCTYRTTCRVHYIFWIASEEQCTTETLYC